jgi:hypothetical protein
MTTPTYPHAVEGYQPVVLDAVAPPVREPELLKSPLLNPAERHALATHLDHAAREARDAGWTPDAVSDLDYVATLAYRATDADSYARRNLTER